MQNHELSKDEMAQVVQNNLKQVNLAIYNQVIQKRVLDNVGDKEASAAVVAQLVKLEKMKDQYTEILKELE